ncbi:MAG: 3-isopropylmalate dehydratase large subunit [Peptococcaceae bacterium]|nr:3-isopropylmalate dehydratase large subunit [Peptococcaceae bacterium]
MQGTLTQKLLAKAAGREAVQPGEIVHIEPDLVMTHDHQGPMTLCEFNQMGIKKVWNPEKIVIVLDHRTPTQSTIAAQNHQLLRKFAKDQGITRFFDVGEGICHDILAEKGFVQPGKLIVATDSHTVTAGAIGAFATGIGSSEMAAVWARGKLWLRVPETIKVILTGKPPAFVGGKDVALKLLQVLTTDGATYKAVEFHGDGLRYLNMDERMTLCNMCLEMGAKNAIIPPDEVTEDFLKEKEITDYEVITPDKNAEYSRVIEINLLDLEPLVAKPYSPDNVAAAKEVEEENVVINQAIIGTCTNGRMTDMRLAAKILEGKKVKPGVRFLIVPATKKVYLQAVKEGLVEIFTNAGAMVGVPCCGPCGAYGMGAMADDEVCITAGSRNFVGRLGAPEARIYLGNSATVAASAVAGKVIDPRSMMGGV